MTDQVTPPMTLPTSTRAGRAVRAQRSSRDQRKTIIAGGRARSRRLLVAGQLGEWRIAAASPAASCSAMVNHLVTEYWLLQDHHLG